MADTNTCSDYYLSDEPFDEGVATAQTDWAKLVAAHNGDRQAAYRTSIRSTTTGTKIDFSKMERDGS